MGSQSYDYLVESPLFDSENIETTFGKITGDTINLWLQEYRSHIINSQKELQLEVADSLAGRLFVEDKNVDIKFLKQAALYVPQIVIDDPLFALTTVEGQFAKVGKEFMGMSTGIDRNILTETLKHLRIITPMVANDYVKIVPANLLTEPPTEIGLSFPQNLYRDVLPSEILNYCKAHAKMQSMHKQGALWALNKNLEPARGILISFGDYKPGLGYIFHLLESRTFPTEDPNIFTFIQTLPEKAPEKDHFDIWVEQSLNSSSIRVVNEIIANRVNAHTYNSSLLSHSKFACELLATNPNVSVEEKTINGVLALDLPFLESVSISDLMSVRDDDKKAFFNFRLELEKIFRSLKTTDSDDIFLAAQNAQHELLNVQIPRLKSSLSNFKKSALYKISPALLGLTSTFVAGPSLLSVSVSALSLASVWRDLKIKEKENPAIFLHRLAAKSGRLAESETTDKQIGPIKSIRYTGVQTIPASTKTKNDQPDNLDNEGIIFI